MRDILITAIVFGAIPFILKRPWVGILLWSWISYMNPHRLAYGFAYDFPYAFIIAIVTILAFLFSRERKEFIWTRETILLLIFIAWMLLTTIASMYPDLAWIEWDRVWKIQLFVIFSVILINQRHKLDWLIWIMVISLGFYGIKGGIFTLVSGGSNHVWGPSSSYIEGNNELALALVMIIPLLWYLLLQSAKRWVKFGLAGATLLTAIAILGSQSRGALLAIAAMGFFLWLKSRHKISTGVFMIVVISILAASMPQSWYDRMNTIQTYKTDASALGRINAWHTAFNVATNRVTGGGFAMFQPPTFRVYAPDPNDVHDAHSIYFQVLGEHGFIGLSLFLLMWVLTWFTAQKIIRAFENDAENKWAANLAAMAQVSMVGYAVGGAFLGLAYFDLPYHILVIVVVTAKLAGLYNRLEMPHLKNHNTVVAKTSYGAKTR